MRILVVAPHPDDEVLGCGGTIAKFSSKKQDVFVLIATKASPPLFSEELIVQGRKEAKVAHDLLGVKKTFFCDLPAAALDDVLHRNINSEINEVIQEVKPDLLFLPFLGDIHLDHQKIFQSALVAARPNQVFFPKKILAYETLSETNWNAPYITPFFQPNVFINISNHLDMKLQAFSCYKSQVKEFPHERSTLALESLARLRGATINCHAAEAFVLVREIID